MSKRAVTFTKPEEPRFLRKLKEQIGYKEGPTVETKKEQLDPVTQEDLEDNLEEQPTVVVLQPGDLSAEEAARIKDELKKEAEEAPADLKAPIFFKAPWSQKSSKRASTSQASDEKKPSKKLKNKGASTSQGPDEKKSSKRLKNRALLSFDEEEDDDN